MSESRIYTRSFAELALRAEEGGDGRTLVGRFVPYNTPTQIDSTLVEEFVPGAFARQIKDPSRIPLAMGHLPHGGSVIGRVLRLWDEPDGLYGEARVSGTGAGNDALELVRDGVYDSWSIGFRALQDVRKGPVTVRKTAHLTEIALVLRPAYEQAKVLAMREDAEVEAERAAACPDCGRCTGADGDLTEEARAQIEAELREAVRRAMRPLPPPFPPAA